MADPFEPIENRLNLIQGQLETLIKLVSSNSNNQQEDLIGVKDAAKLLKVAVQTLYIKTSKKLIPHRKHGKHLIFSRKELHQFINEHNVKTVAEEVTDNEMHLLKMKSKNRHAA